ncbi:hypothetical protein BOTBODRAFT_514183 [Botryobasidium botryosum FD-172 SS1]|uniref:Protein kinase domain-containing protein n=1 Tax=Botryobasidium botryosum (strain FD-172 SS1) TaxID=930990 RepID=A0A067MSE8_BOTB1|nr:hypothetical protein BOTBODRAFT_514183 [Botryobasidium botryosum FD-172 SS1]
MPSSPTETIPSSGPLLLASGPLVTALESAQYTELVDSVTRMLDELSIEISTPNSVMQLISDLRQRLFSSPADRDVYVGLLYQLYSAIKSYPAHPTLHEYEITRCAMLTPSSGGGFADCWEGTFLGELKVAMKTPRADLKEVAKKRLEREIRVWCRLRHQNILPFIGCFTLEGTSYMISPWVENGNALAYVRRSPHSRCLDLLAQVASGLQYLHGFVPPVIHGDLKSSNILVSEQGTPFITDFGLSAVKSAQNAIDSNSSAWRMGGHPRWQAPELLLEVDARRTEATDMFAFGRVMLEFTTGEVPFSELNTNQVLLEVIAHKPPARPRDDDAVKRGLDGEMWRLMQRCWSKHPSQRPVVVDVVAYLQSRLEKPLASAAATTPWRTNSAGVAAALMNPKDLFRALAFDYVPSQWLLQGHRNLSDLPINIALGSVFIYLGLLTRDADMPDALVVFVSHYAPAWIAFLHALFQSIHLLWALVCIVYFTAAIVRMARAPQSPNFV